MRLAIVTNFAQKRFQPQQTLYSEMSFASKHVQCCDLKYDFKLSKAHILPLYSMLCVEFTSFWPSVRVQSLTFMPWFKKKDFLKSYASTSLAQK